ncbi:uncharacterized protein LOC135383070 [Ornithodoros turicata]|uniref:uncharacterized protein LOC135383070 n=1 Tax=Ornithodoros turicata TaxID=34597 RepID=UPI003139DF3F
MKRSCSVVLYLSLSFIFHVSANPAPYGKCTDIEGHHYQLPGKGHKTDHDGCIVTYEPNECKYLCYKPYVPRGEVVQWRNRPDGTWCPIMLLVPSATHCFLASHQYYEYLTANGFSQ